MFDLKQVLPNWYSILDVEIFLAAYELKTILQALSDYSHFQLVNSSEFLLENDNQTRAIFQAVVDLVHFSFFIIFGSFVTQNLIQLFEKTKLSEEEEMYYLWCRCQF